MFKTVKIKISLGQIIFCNVTIINIFENDLASLKNNNISNIYLQQ